MSNVRISKPIDLNIALLDNVSRHDDHNQSNKSLSLKKMDSVRSNHQRDSKFQKGTARKATGRESIESSHGRNQGTN